MIFFGMVSGNSKHTYAIGNCINWLKNAIKCSFRKVTVWSNFTEFSNFGHITNAVLTIRLLHWAWLSLRYCFTVPPPHREAPTQLRIDFGQVQFSQYILGCCVPGSHWTLQKVDVIDVLTLVVSDMSDSCDWCIETWWFYNLWNITMIIYKFI